MLYFFFSYPGKAGKHLVERPMFTVLLVIAVIAVAGIIFFLVTELNELEKTVTSLVQKLSKRYEP